ncbi:PHP domain-containing protein [Archaeoglobales archaeon]|nr:MAG: PHP domain-containing protein [Archaeoglobales archaeon]
MLKYEPHVHSNHSDGNNSVKEILDEAIKKKIEIISITDHDTLNGSLEAIEIVNEEHLPIIVIPGIEISTKNGHLLVYRIDREVEKGMEMAETIKAAKELGGFTVLTHPFEFYRHGCVKPNYFKHVDAVEVFNAKSYLNFLASYFANKYKKPIMAGSDAHSVYTIGYGLTLVDLNVEMKHKNDNTVSNRVFEAIMGFKVKIEGKRVPLRLRLTKLFK